MKNLLRLAFAGVLMLQGYVSYAQYGPEGAPPSFFEYATSLHCQYGPNIFPFNVQSAGLYPFVEPTGNVVFINSLTGEIDMLASNPGTWTIKRVAPNDSTFQSVTITPRDNGQFQYQGDTLCLGGNNTITPMVLGTSGGTFSSPDTGMVIQPVTGAIDLSQIAPGTYTLVYTTAGTCPDTTSRSITFEAPVSPFFDYPFASYCNHDLAFPDTVASPGVGTFSAFPSGLVIDPVTGIVDLAASTPAIYLVQYQIPGACRDSFQFTLQVIAPFTGPLFLYVDSMLCWGEPSVSPMLLGPTNLVFSASSGIVFSNSLGEINPSACPPGTYEIEATALTACGEVTSQMITIGDTTRLFLMLSGNVFVAPGPGSNFSWFLNGTLIPGATDSTLTATAAGLYEVRYHRVGDTCGTVAVGSFTNANEPLDWMQQFHCHPQPSTGVINYDILLRQPSAIQYTVYDLAGRKVHEGEWGMARRHLGTLALSHLQPGHYQLQLVGKNGRAVHPLVLLR